jgi:3-oxoacyl-[acyl-carrier protein] reductase|tara:strand:- start:19024 stop:19782 length:759 start_codon:yes stop_codon:yes gene_type:complete
VNTAHGIAVVTGAAQGIGSEIAIRLATDGFDVAVLDLDATACLDTVRAVEARGRRAVAVGADVADEDAVAAAIATIRDELGAVNVLVNNAGVLRDALLGKMAAADWDQVLAVNLRGSFLMCRAVEGEMRAAKWGRIINLSSTAAVGDVGRANYSAAKAGLIGFTKTLALELGRFNITVNAVAPGFTVTAMTSAVAQRVGMTIEELTAEVVKDIAVGRAGAPADIAHAVSFFADGRSGFVSGQVLYVAGGPVS